MTPKQIVMCLVFSVSLAIGQILFKKSAQSWNESTNAGVMGIVSPWLISALVIYGASTLLWVFILRSAPLSKAYLFALLGAAIVPLAALLIFKEELSVRYLVGVSVTFVGVYLCVSA